jgi:hypothetical protein
MAMSSSARIFPDGRSLVYAVHDGRGPSDAEWDVYLENVRKALRATRDPTHAGGLTVTDGGAPNAKQRRLLVGVTKEECGETMVRIRGAILSDSALVRGVVTALSWHIPEVRTFAPSRIAGAFEHVRLPASDIATVLADLDELGKTVPHGRTLRALVDQLRATRAAPRP